MQKRRLSLDHIQKLLRYSFDFLIILDKTARVVYISSSSQPFLGYTSDELIKKDSLALIHPDDKPLIQELLRKLVLNPGDTVRVEHRIRHKNGTWLFVEGVGSNMLDDSDIQGFLIYIRNIDKHKKTENKLRSILIQQRGIHSHLAKARENERQSIASRVHDEVGQNLSTIKLELGWMKENLHNRGACKKRLHNVLGFIDNTIEGIQNISGDLRTELPDKLGLISALQYYCRDWQNRTGVPVKLSLDNCLINKNTELSLFRIVQEAFTNIARHAKATEVSVELCHSDEDISLTIKDNGVGIPEQKINHLQSYGIIGMRERARACNGQLTISAVNGTIIHIHIPLNSGKDSCFAFPKIKETEPALFTKSKQNALSN